MCVLNAFRHVVLVCSENEISEYCVACVRAGGKIGVCKCMFDLLRVGRPVGLVEVGVWVHGWLYAERSFSVVMYKNWKMI